MCHHIERNDQAGTWLERQPIFCLSSNIFLFHFYLLAVFFCSFANVFVRFFGVVSVFFLTMRPNHVAMKNDFMRDIFAIHEHRTHDCGTWPLGIWNQSTHIHLIHLSAEHCRMFRIDKKWSLKFCGLDSSVYHRECCSGNLFLFR